MRTPATVENMEIVTPTTALLVWQSLTFVFAIVWLWAIVHILLSKQASIDKIFWLLAVTLVPVIAAVVYLIRKVRLRKITHSR